MFVGIRCRKARHYPPEEGRTGKASIVVREALENAWTFVPEPPSVSTWGSEPVSNVPRVALRQLQRARSQRQW